MFIKGGKRKIFKIVFTETDQLIKDGTGLRIDKTYSREGTDMTNVSTLLTFTF